MNRTIRILRLTAKLLLVAIPLTLLSGFLATKFLFRDAIAPATAREWHVLILPWLFVPLLYLHSLTGLLFLIGRHKKLNLPGVRVGAIVLWTVFLGLLAYLYAARNPTRSRGPVPLEEPPAALEDAGAAEPSLDAAGPPAPPDAAPPADAAPGPDESASAPDVDASISEGPPPSPDGASTPPAEAAGPAPDAAGETRTASDAAGRPRGDRRGEGLVRARCGGCHGLDVVYDAPRSAAQWTAVVDRMIDLGAQLDDGERASVVRHLAAWRP